MSEIERAIATLQKSNELLERHIEQLKKVAGYVTPKFLTEYYGTVEKCTDEFDAVHLAIQALRAQQERENPKPLTLIFGDGTIGVSTCYTEGYSDSNPDELLLWNPKMQQKIGDPIPIQEGTTTDDIEVYARLIFKNAESAQVVVDALNRIISAYAHPPKEAAHV